MNSIAVVILGIFGFGAMVYGIMIDDNIMTGAGGFLTGVSVVTLLLPKRR